MDVKYFDRSSEVTDDKKIKTISKNSNANLSITEILPTEILIRIASNLSYRDLALLSLTCSVWNDINKFIIPRRGPQTFMLSLHSNKENRSCTKCYMSTKVFFSRIQRKIVGEIDSFLEECDDYCPARELLKSSLFCQPRYIFIFSTPDDNLDSLVVNEKLVKKLNIKDCSWFMFETKGLRHGNTEITRYSGKFIGLFLPGGRKKNPLENLLNYYQEKHQEDNFIINWISPAPDEILRASNILNIGQRVDELLKNVTICARNNILQSTNGEFKDFITESIKISLDEKNEDNVILLVFFSSKYLIELYLKSVFEEISCRYQSKFRRISIFGIAINSQAELNSNLNAVHPCQVNMYWDLNIFSLTSINTGRTYWTVGLICLGDDNFSQKIMMKKHKERMSFPTWDLLTADNLNKNKFSIIALCSIGTDEWCVKTQALHNNLSEIFKGIEFEFILRGKHYGYIAFDENNPCFDDNSLNRSPSFFSKSSSDNYKNIRSIFEKGTNVGHGYEANYLIIITKNP